MPTVMGFALALGLKGRIHSLLTRVHPLGFLTDVHFRSLLKPSFPILAPN